jgi:Fe-S cluster biogenesis protein NfuA
MTEPQAPEPNLEEKIRHTLESEVRPFLQADGGDLSFIALEGKTVKVQLRGACGHCPGAAMTLKMGVERVLRERVDPDLVVQAV